MKKTFFLIIFLYLSCINYIFANELMKKQWFIQVGDYQNLENALKANTNVVSHWNTIESCTSNNIAINESVILDAIRAFENSKDDLKIDKYIIKTSNNLVMKADLFIDNKLETSISFDSDIRYRYKAFLYRSEFKEQPYKLIVMEMIARDDDSDSVDGYYVYVLKKNKVVTHFNISDPIPIYDYYYLANYENYHEMDKHNVTEYLSAFIKDDTLILVLNKRTLKPTDNKDLQGSENIYLCKKII